MSSCDEARIIAVKDAFDCETHPQDFAMVRLVRWFYDIPYEERVAPILGAELHPVDSDRLHGDPPAYITSASEALELKIGEFTGRRVNCLIRLLPLLSEYLSSPILEEL